MGLVLTKFNTKFDPFVFGRSKMNLVSRGVRERIISLINDGLSTHQIAKKCTVRRSSLCNEYCRNVILLAEERSKKLSNWRPENCKLNEKQYMTTSEATSTTMVAKLCVL